MIKTKTFDLIDYSNNLSDISDNFWHDKLETDIIHFITREKEVPKDNLRIIISHPYEGNVIIIENKYLFHHIHEFCVKNKINPEQFKIITGNWQIFRQYKHWKRTYFNDTKDIDIEVDFILAKIYAPQLFDIPNKNNIIPKIKYEPVPDKPQGKGFIYNCLNKQPNRHRITVYQHLMEKQLMHQGIVSFNKPGDNTILGRLPEYLYNQLPITYDVHSESNDAVMSYGDIEYTQAIEQSELTNIPNQFAELYQQSHLSVVTETLLGNIDNKESYCSSRIPHYDECDAIMAYNSQTELLECPVCGKPRNNPPTPEWVPFYYCGFITEKTFRPLLNGHPFLLVGPKHTLKMLKHLGFKTFDVAWKEDYDNIDLPMDRVARIMQILEDLCNKTPEEWQVINEKLLPILQHNQQTMLNLTETPKLTWKNYPQFD